MLSRRYATGVGDGTRDGDGWDGTSGDGGTYRDGAAHGPPAGWYADPQGRGQRYWSGSTWTEQLAPGTAFAPSTASAPAGDWVGGVLLSLLLPLIGLIAGVVYVAQGGPKRDVGIMCIALSCVAFVVFAAMLSGGG